MPVALDHQLPFWARILRTNSRRIADLEHRVGRVEAHLATWRHRNDNDLKSRWQQLMGQKSSGKMEAWDRSDAASTILERVALAALSIERVTGLAPYRVQMIGTLALLDDRLIEMRTGEGKTLTALMAALARAADGDGVHIVTVNGYLAQRDAALAARVGAFLGMTAAAVVSLEEQVTRMSVDEARNERRCWYQADIVYATATEVGFDWLRDHMVLKPEDRVLRGLSCAIVDEADSVLIDEARMPLVISGRADTPSDLYIAMNHIAGRLTRQATETSEGDYFVDEKEKNVVLSEQGMTRAEEEVHNKGLLVDGDELWQLPNLNLVAHLLAALKANAAYGRDREYLVQQTSKGKILEMSVLIVDERTGRAMPGHRWNEGLHQAIEAKEGVRIHPESQPRAVVSVQQLFRQYAHLSGMTGTAATESEEFTRIYGLEVVVLPTHRPMIRVDEGDAVFMDRGHKNAALIEHIIKAHQTGRPVLVGTGSIADNEELSALLSARGIPHRVLNAKEHAQEANVVAQAGRLGAITLATNMAGRGTDIVLGGDLEHLVQAFEVEQERIPNKDERADLARRAQEERTQVVAGGGLLVLGAERHESRRVDQQLRGRAGRQGDPGSSHFYVSFDDPLIRTFASAKAKQALGRVGGDPKIPVHSRLVTWKITEAQKQMELFHSGVRTILMDYDSVLQEQRTAFYTWRDDLLNLTGKDLDDYLNLSMREALADQANALVGNRPVDEILGQLSLPVDWASNRLEELVGGARRSEDHSALFGIIEQTRETLAAAADAAAAAAIKSSDRRGGSTAATAQGDDHGQLGSKTLALPISGRRRIKAASDGGPAGFDEWRQRAGEVGTALENTGHCKMVGMDDIQRELFFWLTWTRWEEGRKNHTAGQEDKLRSECRSMLLRTYDLAWRSHLVSLDLMRAGIHLRGYAQENPRHAYRYEAFSLFQHMLGSARLQAAQSVMAVCYPTDGGQKGQPTSQQPDSDALATAG